MTITAEDHILYLNRSEVEIACNSIDPVAVIRDVFKLHGSGQVIFLMRPTYPGQMITMNR